MGVIIAASIFAQLSDTIIVFSNSSNNSPLSLMVTMTLFGNMASRVQGDVYFTGVHEIIALTNLPPFHHMQRPFIVKKHSALGNTFPIVVGFRVSA